MKFNQLMQEYPLYHTNPTNKLLHRIGIPLIIMGMILVLTRAVDLWIGVVLFVTGWVLLGVGHKIEGNKPALLKNALFFIIAPLWLFKDLKAFVFREKKP